MRNVILDIAASLVVSLITAAVAAADQRVPLGEVPAPVVDAVKAMYPAGVILDKTEKDGDGGATTYEVKLRNHGKRFEVEVDGDGAVRELKGEVAPLDLPKAVTAALREKFPDGATTTAEEHVEFDRNREFKTFEVVVLNEGRPIELTIRPDGVIEDVDVDD